MWQQVQLALSQSAHRVLVKLASFLPGLLALLLAVCVLTLIGLGLAALLRRILMAVKFDERLARNSIVTVADWAPAHSPTLLLARSAFWICVLIGVFMGVSAFDAAYPGDVQISLFVLPYLTHSVGAVILLIVGSILARFLARSVLIGAVNAKLQHARFLSLGVKWLVLILTAAMVLDHLQVGGVVIELAFGLLFGGIVLTLALAVGLGARDLVSRSLEKTVEHTPEFPPGHTPGHADLRPPPPTETLRHF